MNMLNAYYIIKPIIPEFIRIGIRRHIMQRRRIQCKRIWPILERAGEAPSGWKGWPNNKKFAFVLTHDVEGIKGFNRCMQLVNMEDKLGFRSAFNFVPNGSYKIPESYRKELIDKGYEIGIHDLRHDGKLYVSKEKFEENAVEINKYLHEWNVAGFRSAFMMHNLEWIKTLDIEYDCSTFDTDPFEPQADGVETIFPYIIERPDGSKFVELPYSLVQDFTLFVILQEKTIDIWKKKIAWIAEKGGMALVNVHPDYMDVSNKNINKNEYNAKLYKELLEHIKYEYRDTYWHATPMEVSNYIIESYANGKNANATKNIGVINQMPAKRKIWIDLDNTPHVPFFKPIINQLRLKGYCLLITARDAFQVYELADQAGIDYIQIGRHNGKNPIAKVVGMVYRALQLAPYAMSFQPTIAINHGSRAQTIICNLLGIGNAAMSDYEHGKEVPFMPPAWEIVPQIIPSSSLHAPNERIRKYSGLKENVYLSEFIADSGAIKDLGIDETNIIITIRPPATEAHYHNKESEQLFQNIMEMLYTHNHIQIVLLPRNHNQELQLRQGYPDWFASQNIIVPPKAINGLNIIFHSDLVIGGGGTMNREAVALNVPVYSIFRGTIGALDRHLSKSGKLIMIENVNDIQTKIKIKKRARSGIYYSTSNSTINEIIKIIEEIFCFYEQSANKCSKK
jgi:uncharacterized protein